MGIKEQLVGKTAKEKNIIKINALKDLTKVKKFKYKAIYDVDIVSINVENELLKLHIIVNENHTEIYNDIFFFKNPPILIPDGTFYTETYIDKRGIQKTRQAKNFIEDLDGALEEMIKNTLDVII